MRASCLAAIAAWELVAGRATAQDVPPPAAPDPAVVAFDRGVAAADEGRWTDAVAAFEEAYSLRAAPLMLFNLAGARARLGRLVAARDDYRRFAREARTPAELSLRLEAEQTADDLEARLGRLRARIRGLRPGDRIELDGEPVAPGALDGELEVDPGTHVLDVIRGGADVAHQRFVAQAGRFEVTLTVREPLPAPGPQQSERSSVFASPWLWIGLGAVAAAAVVLAIVLASGEDAPPSQLDGDLGRIPVGP